MSKKGTANYDVLYKVRPMLDSLQEKCRDVAPEECHLIDKQVMPTKARCPIRQYLPNTLWDKWFLYMILVFILESKRILTRPSNFVKLVQ